MRRASGNSSGKPKNTRWRVLHSDVEPDAPHDRINVTKTTAPKLGGASSKRGAPEPRLALWSGALAVCLCSGLTMNRDPASPYYAAQLIGYNASKAALNMLTVQLNAELGDSAIVVNSVSPGFVKTDLTGGAGYMTPAEGAVTPVRYALIEDDSVSGRNLGPDGELPW